MKPLSLEMAFPELRNDITQWKDQINESGQLPAELMSEEEGLDVCRWYVLYLANNGLVDEAIQELSTINRDLYAGTLG